MYFAHRGLSALNRKHFGKGPPLFNDLQYPWFARENEGLSIYEEGQYEDEFLTTEQISLMNGFSSYHQFNRWMRGVNKKWTKEALAEFRYEFPGVLRRVGGGSYIRLNRNDEGREVAVQSTTQRFWWRRDRDNRMLCGFTFTVRAVARREDSGGDAIEFCIHDTWHDETIMREQKETDYWPPPACEATEMLKRFLRTRVGMDSLSCRITVACDGKKGSREIAKALRDIVNISTRDDTSLDIDPFFLQQVRSVPAHIFRVPFLRA